MVDSQKFIAVLCPSPSMGSMEKDGLLIEITGATLRTALRIPIPPVFSASLYAPEVDLTDLVNAVREEHWVWDGTVTNEGHYRLRRKH